MTVTAVDASMLAMGRDADDARGRVAQLTNQLAEHQRLLARTREGQRFPSLNERNARIAAQERTIDGIKQDLHQAKMQLAAAQEAEASQAQAAQAEKANQLALAHGATTKALAASTEQIAASAKVSAEAATRLAESAQAGADAAGRLATTAEKTALEAHADAGKATRRAHLALLIAAVAAIGSAAQGYFSGCPRAVRAPPHETAQEGTRLPGVPPTRTSQIDGAGSQDAGAAASADSGAAVPIVADAGRR